MEIEDVINSVHNWESKKRKKGKQEPKGHKRTTFGNQENLSVT